MNLHTLQPRGPRLLVKRIKLDKDDFGAIIGPGNEYGNYAFATVLAIGPGNATVSHVGGQSRYMGETPDLTVGDMVIMKTGTNENRMTGASRVDMGLPFTVAGEKVELIGEGAIIAIITKSV